MNKQRHRIVFNKRRGQYMAVAETTCADGKATGTGPASRRLVRKALAPMVGAPLALVAVFMASAQAQIVADPRAAATQRPTVLAAPTIGYSTGPSGVALQKLFERWGIADEIKSRIVQARPGVPVGSMIASGEVALGFQQLSELIHVEGIRIVGGLPAAIAIDTVFSAGVVTGSAHADAVQRLLAFMASPEAEAAKRRQGMEPA